MTGRPGSWFCLGPCAARYKQQVQKAARLGNWNPKRIAATAENGGGRLMMMACGCGRWRWLCGIGSYATIRPKRRRARQQERRLRLCPRHWP